jgi:signal transduction histidine kinase
MSEQGELVSSEVKAQVPVKARVTKVQSLLAIIAVMALIALGVSSIIESRAAAERSQLLSNIESPAASIIFTQRETLVYATRLALWSNGGTTRRDVQIARNLLAQRLAVVDSSGRSMGSRANDGYWDAITRADEIVAKSPMGVLPEGMHAAINVDLLPVIDGILAEARNLVVSYQRSVDDEILKLAQDNARHESINLALLYLFILSGGLFLILNLRSNFRRFKEAQEAISGERLRLEAAHERVAQLQDLDAAKNALISTVNHELRTPLTSIIGYVELMQRESKASDNPERELHLEVIARNSQILLNLVESILSLSKFDSDMGRLPDTPVNLTEVISNTLFILKPALEAAQVSISSDLEDGVIVEGDNGQLTQLIINLISNAVKFSEPGGTVEVRLNLKEKKGANWAEISIKDNGIGIPKNDIPLLFTRFFRAGNVGSGSHPGSGLGLAIVKQVVQHHGGSIEVFSEISQGSTFLITLPIRQGEVNEL